MHRSVALLLAFFVVGCAAQRAPSEPPVVDAKIDKPRVDPSHPVMINFDRASVGDVLMVVKSLSGDDVLVDVGAIDATRCATITLRQSERIPAGQAIDKLVEAVRAKGFTVTRAGRAFTVTAEQGKVAACSPIEEPARAQQDPTQEILRAIREVSPTEHVISRRGADLLLENQQVLGRSGRVVPEVSNGAVTGLRLFGIRPDSVMGRLGFENGDRVERVNGQSIATPDKALEAYARLRDASVIEVEIVRRGAPTKLVIVVE